MTRSFTFIILLTLVMLKGTAQNLQLINIGNQADITGATIEIQSQDNHGWVGYESLDLSVKVINISGGQLEIGSKKIEHDTLQNDVQHTFCFGGLCYPPAVFISPQNVILSSGSSDSSFIAHYLFDNRVHVRGVNHVSYIFYDVNNPNDSFAVNVIYNTVVNGIDNPINNHVTVSTFPNPVTNEVTFQFDHSVTSHPGKQLTLINSFGEYFSPDNLNVTGNQISFSTASLSSGIYYYRFTENDYRVIDGKIVVVH
jgi:hypothetical protein